MRHNMYLDTGTVIAVDDHDRMCVVVVEYADGEHERFGTTNRELAEVGRRVINLEGVGLVVAAA